MRNKIYRKFNGFFVFSVSSLRVKYQTLGSFKDHLSRPIFLKFDYTDTSGKRKSVVTLSLFTCEEETELPDRNNRKYNDKLNGKDLK